MRFCPTNGSGAERYSFFSYVEFEFYVVIPGKQIPGTVDVVVVDVYIAESKSNRLQRQIDLPGHEVEVVNIGGKSQVGIGTALIGRHYQIAAVELELYEAEARCLVGLRVGGTEEEHIVLTAALLSVDFSIRGGNFSK